MTPERRSAEEWASEWDRLQRCPHSPPHDNENEYLSAEAYDACLADFFSAFAAQECALEVVILKRRVETLEKALMESKIRHLVVDGDCWFSCPKSGECCRDDQDKDKCECGTDQHNARIEAALRGEETWEEKVLAAHDSKWPCHHGQPCECWRDGETG